MGIIDIVIVIIIFHLVLFSVFLFTGSKVRQLSNKILSAFFLTLAINIFNGLCFRLYDYVLGHCPHLFFTGSSFAYLYAPLFYFYIKSLTERGSIIRKYDIIHFMPFILYTIYLMVIFYFKPADIKREMIINNEVITPVMWKILTGLLHIQIVIYIILSVRNLRLYKYEVRNIYSSLNKASFSWLKFLVAGLTLLWLTDITRFLATLYAHELRTITEAFLFLGFLLLCYIIVYKAMVQPEIFTKFISLKKQKRQSLSKSLSERYMQKLLLYMENEKPYYDPDITLIDLSERVSIPPRSLSEVINNALGQNFYDFINSYRIKESERLLAKESTPFKTILEVMYEVGFNNKTSFNNTFKKSTGMTPTQFKKMVSLTASRI